MIQIQGVIKGRQIELEREPELPSGSLVMVQIHPKPLTLAEKRQLAHSLCGAWSDDPTIGPIFDEIDRRRSQSPTREVDLDAAS